MESIDIIMLFIMPAIIAIVGTIGVLMYIKKHAPTENQRNTSLLLNIADEGDDVGLYMLGYIFSWINAVVGWCTLILAIIMTLIK
jgi:hypothetical protein